MPDNTAMLLMSSLLQGNNILFHVIGFSLHFEILVLRSANNAVAVKDSKNMALILCIIYSLKL